MNARFCSSGTSALLISSMVLIGLGSWGWGCLDQVEKSPLEQEEGEGTAGGEGEGEAIGEGEGEGEGEGTTIGEGEGAGEGEGEGKVIGEGEGVVEGEGEGEGAVRGEGEGEGAAIGEGEGGGQGEGAVEGEGEASGEGEGECEPEEQRSCGAGPQTGMCSFGVQTCDARGRWGECRGAVGPAPEVCDGLDNDCDDQTDETELTCKTEGVCSEIRPSCTRGGGWTCDYGMDYQELESRCDNLDNDCDGRIDLDACCDPEARLFGWGAGTPDNPYLICSSGQLRAITSDAPRHFSFSFKVTSDIDLGEEPFIPIGTVENPFTGTFDGGGHQIAGLTIELPEAQDVGLFGFLSAATVTNLTLVDVEVVGDRQVGALTGRAYHESRIASLVIRGGTVNGKSAVGGAVGALYLSTMEDLSVTNLMVGRDGMAVGGLIGWVAWNPNDLLDPTLSVILRCQTTDTVEVRGSDWVGGLVGGMNNIPPLPTQPKIYFKQSSSNAQVYGNSLVGGLLGYGLAVVIEDCQSSGMTSVFGRGANHGGLVGYLEGPSIVWDCASSVSITMPQAGTGAAGGLVGVLGGNTRVYGSTATGRVTGGSSTIAGGLVGLMKAGSAVYHSFATGDVTTGGYAGGLIGEQQGGEVVDCFAGTSEATVFSISRSAGGLIGNLSGEGRIERCYSVGAPAVGDDAAAGPTGGLIGQTAGDAQVIDSHWDIDASGQADSAGGFGHDTAGMHLAETYTHFDFEQVWVPPTDQDYPVLRPIGPMPPDFDPWAAE